MKKYEGRISGEGKKFGIIVSRFNSTITERLLNGAVDCLVRHGADSNKIEVFKTPGAFEIPSLLSRVIKKFDGVICLGALVRGETSHFDVLSREVTKGIAKIALESGIPVGFGIITADTSEQAIERGGGKQGNRGADAALSVMEQIGLLGTLSNKKRIS